MPRNAVIDPGQPFGFERTGRFAVWMGQTRYLIGW